jgi:hypothetical protein
MFTMISLLAFGVCLLIGGIGLGVAVLLVEAGNSGGDVY